jgi:hypothetical protein
MVLGFRHKHVFLLLLLVYASGQRAPTRTLRCVKLFDVSMFTIMIMISMIIIILIIVYLGRRAARGRGAGSRRAAGP